MKGELRQVLAELELCSHVSAVNLDPMVRETTEEGRGGKRPTGGLDRREDGHKEIGVRAVEERVLRSAQHFRHQLMCGRPEWRVLDEACAALLAWRRQPKPKDPEFGSPQWKRWISESLASDKEIARQFSVSRQYIHRVRRQYREERDLPKPKYGAAA